MVALWPNDGSEPSRGAPQVPTLYTSRLILRPFSLADAATVQRLAGEREIAAMTLTIPHPYPDGAAAAWIDTHASAFANGQGLSLAIVLQATGELCGAIGLVLAPDHHSAEMGYWLGKPYWRQGYCTEAALALLQYGFQTLNLHRIHAAHFAQNLASGRVMQKLGMRQEGYLRQAVLKWGQYMDLVLYGILWEEWLEVLPATPGRTGWV
ncbi:GNAT family N-acetyltransferase [Leptolyngbya sp. 'hensonii']|nr:GNAT family N-acetyltransferase [Leptolyngbya sp. 'hensonii']